jgi:WYL domain
VSVLSKFEQTMTASERKEHGALGQHFAYVPDGGTKAYEGKEDLINALQTGILSRKIVRFSYKDSRGRARSGDLAPFVILMYRQGLYVVGARVGEGHASADLVDWRKGLGVFAVERFVEAEHLRKRTFEIPVDFQIDAGTQAHCRGTHAPEFHVHKPDAGRLLDPSVGPAREGNRTNGSVQDGYRRA